MKCISVVAQVRTRDIGEQERGGEREDVWVSNCPSDSAAHTARSTACTGTTKHHSAVAATQTHNRSTLIPYILYLWSRMLRRGISVSKQGGEVRESEKRCRLSRQVWVNATILPLHLCSTVFCTQTKQPSFPEALHTFRRAYVFQTKELEGYMTSYSGNLCDNVSHLGSGAQDAPF